MSLTDTTQWNFGNTLSDILDKLLGKFEINPTVKLDSLKIELPTKYLILIIGGFVGLYFILKR